jgi:hypothetical protein
MAEQRKATFKENSIKSLSPEDQLRATSLDLFNEDPTSAFDSNGRIIKVDRFKGFTSDQIRNIREENEQNLAIKRYFFIIFQYLV